MPLGISGKAKGAVGVCRRRHRRSADPDLQVDDGSTAGGQKPSADVARGSIGEVESGGGVGHKGRGLHLFEERIVPNRSGGDFNRADVRIDGGEIVVAFRVRISRERVSPEPKCQSRWNPVTIRLACGSSEGGGSFEYEILYGRAEVGRRLAQNRELIDADPAPLVLE